MYYIYVHEHVNAAMKQACQPFDSFPEAVMSYNTIYIITLY